MSSVILRHEGSGWLVQRNIFLQVMADDSCVSMTGRNIKILTTQKRLNKYLSNN